MKQELFRILLIEDDEGDAFLIEELLTDNQHINFDLCWHSYLADGLEALQNEHFHLILLDLSLPDSFGTATFSRLYEKHADLPIIVLSHNDDELLAMKTVQLGAQDYLEKGDINRKSLVRALRYAMERKQTELALLDVNNELAQRSTELETAYNELQQLLMVKDEFLAKMSHELRTPLAAMLISAELIEARLPADSDQKLPSYLQRIQANGQHLLDMINDILDLARSQQNQLDLEHQSIAVSEICQEALRIVEPLANERALDLVANIPVGDPKIMTDARRLKQIIINLLSNAIKFTHAPGQIGLDLETNEQENQICVSVWDTGIGMDPADVPRLLEPFVQHDSSSTRKYGGSGLGLALVKQFCEILGASLNVDTSLGEGTRFEVILPYTPTLKPALCTTYF